MTEINSYSSEIDVIEASSNSIDAYTDSLFEAALLELDELIDRIGPLKNTDVNYLLNYWRHFSIYQVEPYFSEKQQQDEGGKSGQGQIIPQVIRIPGGWKVLDYGNGLITSSGENYGSYSTGLLLKTVKYMVGCLAERGAKAVVFSGALPAKRLAWMECMHLGITNRFNPNTQDLKCREGLSKILEGKFLSFKF